MESKTVPDFYTTYLKAILRYTLISLNVVFIFFMLVQFDIILQRMNDIDSQMDMVNTKMNFFDSRIDNCYPND